MNNSTVALFMFIGLIGFIAYLFWRQRKIFDSIQDFYKAHGLYFQKECPVEHPFVYTDINPICSQGQLKPDMPFTFILGSYSTGSGQSRILHTFLGFFLPNHPALTNEWLNLWRQKVSDRSDEWAQHSGVEKGNIKYNILKGVPDDLPIRAIRINNGVLIAWSGLHTRPVFEKRLKELKDSLGIS